jgi:hypothetical protein
MVVVQTNNIAGKEKISDGMCAVECSGRGEAGELAFQLLRCFVVTFCMVTTNGVDGSGIDRMDTHSDNFQKGHDFRSFGIHIFINGDFDFFK